MCWVWLVLFAAREFSSIKACFGKYTWTQTNTDQLNYTVAVEIQIIASYSICKVRVEHMNKSSGTVYLNWPLKRDKIVLCYRTGTGLRSLTNQTHFTERKGSVELFVQAVSHWNAKASLTHSQVVFDLNQTHSLVSLQWSELFDQQMLLLTKNCLQS